MEELEKAKLLSVASKLAKADIREVKQELLGQINSIKIPEFINGRDGRGIVEARIFDGQLVLQMTDGTLVVAGSVIGEQGPIGPIGEKGDKGDKGDPGPRGDVGPSGKDGLDGFRGERGERGDKGDKGDPGERGIQGEIGPVGPMPDIAPLEKRITMFIDNAERRISRLAFSTAISRSPGSGEVNLHKLDDVDYASLKSATDGQVLVYNASTRKWQAASVSGTSSNTIATVSTTTLGELTENDLVVVNVTGGVINSNTVGILTSALNNALAQISALEARIAALEV